MRCIKSSVSDPVLVLASASSRRHDLLSLLNIPFQVRVAEVDETPNPRETPDRFVIRLAVSKAEAAGRDVRGIILAADTAVVLDGEILGKPVDSDEAKKMLGRLRNRAHRVLTGCTVLDTTSGDIYTHVESTTVWMSNYTDEEVAAYVASGDPMDKAGAYAIQNRAFAPVRRLDGCPANVMGLPVCRVDEMLRQCGIGLEETPVRACRPVRNICAIHSLVVPC